MKSKLNPKRFCFNSVKSSPPGFYPKQSIELTEDNLVADISNMDNMMPMENVVPVDAPLEALTLKTPADYNFLRL